MEWLAFSPDLNPIEQAWGMLLGRAVYNIDSAPTMKEESLLVLQIEWVGIDQRKMVKLVRSMRCRVRECIATQGGPVQY